MVENLGPKGTRFGSSRVSRRRFLHVAGAAAGGVAVGMPLRGVAQDASPGTGAAGGDLVSSRLPSSWDQETDVVVVGTGAAAFAAAVTARQAGAEVVILEKAASPGGTTLISGNTYWIPNNSKMRAEGLTDPREDALKYMARLSYPQLYDPESPTLGMPEHNFDLIATFYDTAAEAVDAFEEWGALYSRMATGQGYSEKPEYGDPDYSADLPEDKAPYGRHVRPDPDRGGEGTIPQQMQAWTDQNDVPLLTEHRVVGAFQNRLGQVVGVRAETADGAQVAIRARKAVVFGSGGFTQDPIKSLNYLRGPVFAGCGVGTNTGDFVDIGLALGAQLGNMNQAWWLQCPLEMALQSPVLPGADVWMAFGDSMVIVNKYGTRFMNEKITYNERGQSHHEWDARRREYRNLVQFMIYDDAVAKNTAEWAFRFPVPQPDAAADYVISGDTWEDLAANISARLDALRGQGTISARIGPDVRLADDFVDRLGETVQRFNGFAESGEDEDFGRGSTPIQVAWHGPPREEGMANPTMAPFRAEGPYHCILLGGMTLDTKGGPVTDTGARVLHAGGDPIPGLYAAGNCAASPSGQAYWSAGGTLGPALAFGYLAGQNAAAEDDKPID